MSEHETFLHVLRSPEPDNRTADACWNGAAMFTYAWIAAELILIGWLLWHRLSAH